MDQFWQHVDAFTAKIQGMAPIAWSKLVMAVHAQALISAWIIGLMIGVGLLLLLIGLYLFVFNTASLSKEAVAKAVFGLLSTEQQQRIDRYDIERALDRSNDTRGEIILVIGAALSAIGGFLTVTGITAALMSGNVWLAVTNPEAAVIMQLLNKLGVS